MSVEKKKKMVYKSGKDQSTITRNAELNNGAISRQSANIGIAGNCFLLSKVGHYSERKPT